MFIQFPLLLPTAGIAAWAVTKYHLNGEDLTKYDTNPPVTFSVEPNSQGMKDVEAYLYENYIRPAQTTKGSRKQQVKARRARFDRVGLAREFEGVTFRPDTFTHGSTKITGEWTIVEDAEPQRRILYIHGGAGSVGSAISHRGIIVNLAKRTKASVFAVNYRLMPEHHRMASVYDVRAAYIWILENGPDGPQSLDKVAVAGDSFGGNLTLSLSHWVRDKRMRPIDAVIALSPATDTTMSGPSIRSNLDSDLMLRALFARAKKIPRPVILWALWSMYRMSPAEPEISPVFADLSNLPPTMVHASASEMLYDDAVRYVGKAQEAGSPVTLQSWDHVPHVWHAFDRLLPESAQAFNEIAKFLKANGFMD